MRGADEDMLRESSLFLEELWDFCLDKLSRVTNSSVLESGQLPENLHHCTVAFV